MIENKRTISFNKIHNFRDIGGLALSETSNLPAIIHCSGGKNRTGWISYLLQSIAGVPAEDIYKDYLFSNKYMTTRNIHVKERILMILSLHRYKTEFLKPMLEARLVYLKNTVDLIIQKYVTIETYLTELCGVPPAQLSKIKNILIEQNKTNQF